MNPMLRVISGMLAIIILMTVALAVGFGLGAHQPINWEFVVIMYCVALLILIIDLVCGGDSV